MKLSHVLAVVCLVLLAQVSFAQGEPGWSKHSLGANFELSLPMGDFGDVAEMGYGGNVRYQYGADRRGVFTATAGYLVWSAKGEGVAAVEPKAFNIFLGGKYYLTEGLYASLEGGLYFVTYDYSGAVLNAEGSVTRFMLPIGVGFQKSGFEAGVRYMLLDMDFNSFSFTVGYNFML